MKLKYLKLNKKMYNLDNKVCAFIGIPNTGKTSIYELLKFIYGAEYQSGNHFNKTLDNINTADPEYEIEWSFSGDDTYTLNVSTSKVFTSDGNTLSVSKYSDYILKKYGYYNKVFNKKLKMIQNFSFNEDVTKKLNSKSDYAKFYAPHNSMTYTSLYFLKLISKQEIEYINILEDYFMLVGKKSNIDAIKKNSNALKKDTVPEEEAEEIKDIMQENDVQRYISFSKFNSTEFDELILKDIENITTELNGFDINKVRDFHNLLLQSYNNVVELEREKIKAKYNILREYSKSELKEIYTYLSINEEMKVREVEVKNEIKDRRKRLDETERFIESINEELMIYCNEFNKQFDITREFNNKLEFKFEDKSRKSPKSLCLNLKSADETTNTGGAETLINFLGFITYVLSKSEFPILLLEKGFLTESPNDTLVNFMVKMCNKLDNEKTIVLFLHPDEEFSELPKDIRVFNLEGSDDKFFGLYFEPNKK